MAPKASNDPRRVVGALVHTKLSQAGCEQELKRRFGVAKYKQCMVEGVVTDVISQPTNGGDHSTYIVAKWAISPTTVKEKKVFIGQVKLGPVAPR